MRQRIAHNHIYFIDFQLQFGYSIIVNLNIIPINYLFSIVNAYAYIVRVCTHLLACK